MRLIMSADEQVAPGLLFTAIVWLRQLVYFFFFNDTATTEIYTLSLHDALPISGRQGVRSRLGRRSLEDDRRADHQRLLDRKSTRLNSSHGYISYAVFCLKKKKTETLYSVDPEYQQVFFYVKAPL